MPPTIPATPGRRSALVGVCVALVVLLAGTAASAADLPGEATTEAAPGTPASTPANTPANTPATLPADAPASESARVPAGAASNPATPAATDPPTAKARNPDPFERLNRATYRFNDFFDRHLARPVARGYRAVLPEIARRGIGNFFANLETPTVIVNDVLQGKLKDAGSDTTRLLVNSVLGVGGFGDPASHFGLVAHDEDFGQTLGRWGVRPGPYLVLPILGPSDLRDAPGRLADHYTSPTYWIRDHRVSYALIGTSLLERRAELLSADEAIDLAFDPYALIRNAYLQRREYVVHDGQIEDDGYGDPLDP